MKTRYRIKYHCLRRPLVVLQVEKPVFSCQYEDPYDAGHYVNRWVDATPEDLINMEKP